MNGGTPSGATESGPFRLTFEIKLQTFEERV
jgi:hypothetical protein